MLDLLGGLRYGASDSSARGTAGCVVTEPLSTMGWSGEWLRPLGAVTGGMNAVRAVRGPVK